MLATARTFIKLFIINTLNLSNQKNWIMIRRENKFEIRGRGKGNERYECSKINIMSCTENCL